MATPNVFICYKRVLVKQREGRTIEQRGREAEILHDILRRDARYTPWMDDAEIGAGMAWETKIYHQILVSDVMVVLIGAGTSQSEWVKREIALANALSISVVPLGFDITWDEMQTELRALGLGSIQAKITNNIRLRESDALLAELGRDLENAAKETKTNQAKDLQGLLDRGAARPPVASNAQRVASFRLRTKHAAVELHVTSGDIAKVRNIDVIVNSENDYMQMARFFESRTVSSILRRLGSSIRDGKYDDTIQRELDYQLRDRGRPVQVAEVFATSTGGPTSDLFRQTRARFILHVAAVQAVVAEGMVIPYKQPYQIESCVRSCLSKLAELNQLKGVVSPQASPQWEEQEKLASTGNFNVRSIIFPIFGTGQGGSTIQEVLGPMISGMQGILDDPEGEDLANYLTDIYVSAFTKQDVQEVVSLVQKELG
jgi:O-acetyl-ADP-ribose deacetylase (regulator of RNase III)